MTIKKTEGVTHEDSYLNLGSHSSIRMIRSHICFSWDPAFHICLYTKNSLQLKLWNPSLSNSRLGWGRKVSAMKKVANIDKVTNSNLLWCQDNNMYSCVVGGRTKLCFLKIYVCQYWPAHTFNYLSIWFQNTHHNNG